MQINLQPRWGGGSAAGQQLHETQRFERNCRAPRYAYGRPNQEANGSKPLYTGGNPTKRINLRSFQIHNGSIILR